MLAAHVHHMREGRLAAVGAHLHVDQRNTQEVRVDRSACHLSQGTQVHAHQGAVERVEHRHTRVTALEQRLDKEDDCQWLHAGLHNGDHKAGAAHKSACQPAGRWHGHPTQAQARDGKVQQAQGTQVGTAPENARQTVVVHQSLKVCCACGLLRGFRSARRRQAGPTGPRALLAQGSDACGQGNGHGGVNGHGVANDHGEANGHDEANDHGGDQVNGHDEGHLRQARRRASTGTTRRCDNCKQHKQMIKGAIVQGNKNGTDTAIGWLRSAHPTRSPWQLSGLLMLLNAWPGAAFAAFWQQSNVSYFKELQKGWV